MGNDATASHILALRLYFLLLTSYFSLLTSHFLLLTSHILALRRRQLAAAIADEIVARQTSEVGSTYHGAGPWYQAAVAAERTTAHDTDLGQEM